MGTKRGASVGMFYLYTIIIIALLIGGVKIIN
jgi:hypothetical protein